MSTGNHQIVKDKIFIQAGHLIGNNNYEEKLSTAPYKNCDCLFVDHENKAFWFTTIKDVQHTQQLAKS